MTPCQVSKEAEQEFAVKDMNIGSFVKEDMNLRCVSNCEDTTFDMDALLIDQKVVKEKQDDDMEIDVVGCTDEGNGNDFRYLGKQVGGDETEEGSGYSSSFGNTCSDNEDGSRMSDNEVDSFYGDSSLFEGFGGMLPLNKKKVSDQWRRYVSPLSWRGKWIELRMKALKSQLSKYERELQSYGQNVQQFDLGQSTPGECSMRTLPFSRQNQRKEVMKRRKRKKLEDTVDVSSYMSHHNLFSYYENKADGGSADDGSSIQPIAADVNGSENLDINFACPSLEIRDNNSMEYLLWKIEDAQSRVQKIRFQLDKVLTENAEKFSSVESLSELAQSEDPVSSPRSPVIAPPINAETAPIVSCVPSQQLADHPEAVESSHGEAAPPPIECKVAQSSEDVHLDQSYFAGSSQNVVNDAARNQEDKKEPHESEKPGGPPIVETLVEVKVEIGTELPPIAPGLKLEIQEANITRQNSIKKSSLPPELNGPTTKRKRGERKPSSGNWTTDAMAVTQILSESGKQMLTSVNQ